VRQKNVSTEVELVPTYKETDRDRLSYYSVARIEAESTHSEVTVMKAEERDDSAKLCAYRGHLT
jgi:hypothetical protein